MLVVNLLCIVLFAGRLIHALGVSRIQEDHRFRVAGMAMTFAAIGFAAALLISHSLAGLT